MFGRKKNDEDCPQELIDLLNGKSSKFQKAVVKEFIELYSWRQKIETKMKQISRENKAIIGLLATLIILALKIAFFGGM